MSGQGYRALKVWTRAVDLAVYTYELSRGFPSEERFGLASQMRRAAVSISSNIAEGNGRFTSGEYRNHLSNARGSLNELETHCEIACRLTLLSPADRDELLTRSTEISRMITGLKRSLR